jgi:hypothetical protein
MIMYTPQRDSQGDTWKDGLVDKYLLNIQG